MSFHLLKLSRDFNKIFETKAFYDVIIRVGLKGSNDAKEFQAHSLILRARVPYFHQYLQSDQAKQEYDKIVITDHNISPAIFEIILKYIYTGKLEFMNCDGRQAFDLLFAADNLGLEEALAQIQDYLINQQRVWMDKNFYSLHRLIYSRKSLNIIQNHYTTRIASNPSSVFEVPDSFNSLILSSLDELGCLKLNETIWGFIVNWAKLQNPGLTNHVTNWRKVDWEEFKESLIPCIPWKSIMNLNWDEFHDLLIPCEPFLPAEKFNTLQKTVVVFKMMEAVYGGYNPLDWKFDHSTSDSFIFNFDHDQVDLKRLNRFAIHKKSGYGPCFGTEDLLAFPHGKRSILWMSKDISKSLPIIDYEVYQILEKPKRANLAASTASSLNYNGYTHKKR
ncbi:12274_t:CDS:2 [Funneliformis geosporum]|uniref:12274_t:CDS:1 n=1 Tax=Funneliformis geosporum TaxID=1117311 RepID=A0A9W4SNZ0_9GLOM|nr:12274_t:CDS:2 [Funneliformis geosporum]